MDWISIGKRIRKQREYLGYTREGFAERIDVTPKFCSDIELGVKGMCTHIMPYICGSEPFRRLYSVRKELTRKFG